MSFSGIVIFLLSQGWLTVVPCKTIADHVKKNYKNFHSEILEVDLNRKDLSFLIYMYIVVSRIIIILFMCF